MQGNLFATMLAKDIKQSFIDFHKQNPHVYKKLVDMSLQLKRRGHKKFGIKTLFEVLRWDYAMKTDSLDNFKLNNNYSAMFSRLIMHRVPELRDFFILRISLADNDDSWLEELENGE